MFDEIICIGTSFTEGHGLIPKFNQDIIDWYKKNKKINLDINLHSYPSVLSKLTNIPTRNLGKCGSSIEYLVRTIDDLFYSEDLSNKLFILEYSSWGRSELYSNKYNKYVVANWGPRDGKNVKNGYESFLTLDYTKHYDDTAEIYWDFEIEKKSYDDYLNNFQDEHLELMRNDRLFVNILYKLYHHNINFLILPLEIVYSPDIENDVLLKSNTIKFSEKNDYAMYHWSRENKLNISSITNDEIKDNHPSVEGYFEIAKKVYEKIKKEYE